MTTDRDTLNSELSICPLSILDDDCFNPEDSSELDSDNIPSTSKGTADAISSPSKRKRSEYNDDGGLTVKKPKMEPTAAGNNCDKNLVPDRKLAVQQIDLKRKTDNNPETEEVDITIATRRGRPKKSQPLEPELAARKEQSLRHLSKFLSISVKYSEFLDKKIQTATPSTSTTTKAPQKQEEEVAEHLKFFTGELRPYQLEGVAWLTILYENSVNGILADEMGLGKTIQIIALFAHLYERKANGPFLVVAPLSTLGNWESEFKRFAPQLPVVRLQGSKLEREEQKKRIRNCHFDGRSVKPVVICSYQIPLMEEAFLRRFRWHYVVVDEGHRLKNAESKLSLQLRNLDSANRTLLTGTPLQNNIKELWALFNFLMPELFKAQDGFSILIELDDVQDTDKLLENENTIPVIQTIHKVLAPFMLRREKKFVLGDMVPKKEVIIYCPLTQVQQYQYLATLQGNIDKLTMGSVERQPLDAKRKLTITKHRYAPIDELSSGNKNVIYKKNVPIDLPDCPYMLYLTMTNTAMMLKKIINHPYLLWTPIDPGNDKRTLYVSEDLIRHSGKLMALNAMLPKLKARGHKVLIFSTLVMFMDMIEEMLIMRDYSFRRLDGSSNFDSRTQNILEFSNNDDVFIFLLSTRAGGLGLNLTAADTVIFMDRDWNPMVDLQAQDRCHRIGQTKPVMIYSLVTKGTIDEVILDRGVMKRRLEKIVIQEGKFKTMKKNFTVNDLKELEKLLKEDESVKIHSNGLMYTDEEWEQILDRQDLLDQMQQMHL